MNLIVVVDKNWGIGKNNDLLFRLKKDMAFFKKTTVGNVVVMGAKTFESFPKGALPDRINVVLDSDGKQRCGAVTVSSVSELDEELLKYDTERVFIIGGASVYRLMLERCDTAYVTKVRADGQAELFFPDLDENPHWKLMEQTPFENDGAYEISFCKYVNTNI